MVVLTSAARERLTEHWRGARPHRYEKYSPTWAAGAHGRVLPEFEPGLVCRLEALAQILTVRIGFFHDPASVVAQFCHP